MNGTDLLAEFRKSRAEGAFGELVRRYTNLVYSVAKRRLSDVSAAQEVTQTVFIRLARAVPDVHSDAELMAWLHRTTVHASIDQWRSDARRRAREQRALAMQTEQTEDNTWNAISPVLDEALNELSDAERQVILMRFFDQRSMRELGLALGISEDAAKMRVSRAMEHLRGLFGERGVACGATVLTASLAQRAVEAAPAGLILSLAALRIPAAATVAPAATIAGFLAQASKGKLAAGVFTVVIAAITVIWIVSARTARQDRAGGMKSTEAALAENAQPSAGASNDTSAATAQTAPDPLSCWKAWPAPEIGSIQEKSSSRSPPTSLTAHLKAPTTCA
jgi:RNA polymerase sigma factor (sigma-70 family)